jgi:hypothetical protein
MAAASKTMTSNGSSSKHGKEVPALLQYWLRLQASLPSIYLGRLDISVTLLTIGFLSSLRFGFTYLLMHAFGWPDLEITRDAAASMVGVVHSLMLVPSLLACFMAHAYSPSQALSASPVWYQTVVSTLLQFCTGYMVYDGTLNILILKYSHISSTDLMFWDITWQPFCT